jgi:hypothetical protein
MSNGGEYHKVDKHSDSAKYKRLSASVMLDDIEAEESRPEVDAA